MQNGGLPKKVRNDTVKRRKAFLALHLAERIPGLHYAKTSHPSSRRDAILN